MQTSQRTGSTSIGRWDRGSRLFLLSTRVLLMTPCSSGQLTAGRPEDQHQVVVLVLQGQTDLEGSRQEGEELAEGGLVQQVLVRVFSLGRLFTGLLHTEEEESCNTSAEDEDEAQMVTPVLPPGACRAQIFEEDAEDLW